MLSKLCQNSGKDMVDAKYGNKDCAMSADIREFLAERTDLDAVVTATGDRWHALASIMAMHGAMTTVHAANICMWLGRNLKYDPVKEEFVNDPQANRLSARAMRAPWIA